MWLGVNAEQKPLEEQRRRRARIEPALTPQAPYRHWSPMHPPYSVPLIDTARRREVDEITAALAGAGTLDRRQLARLVHAGLWGPGRFASALHEAVARGKVRRTGRGLYALVPGAPDPVKPHDPGTGLSTAAEPAAAPSRTRSPSTQPPRDVTAAGRPDGSE